MGYEAPCALTISSSDGSGAGGVHADVATFTSCGVRAVTALTALAVLADQPLSDPAATVWCELSTDLVTRQIERAALLTGIDAVKIGMLPSEPVIEAVALALRRLDIGNVVVDPCVQEERLARGLCRHLLPLSVVMTPTIAQLRLLTGADVHSRRTAVAAAQLLLRWGATWVLIQDADSVHGVEIMTDVLVGDRRVVELRGPYGVARPPQGNSSAFAACLARGMDVVSAAQAAQRFIAGPWPARHEVRHASPPAAFRRQASDQLPVGNGAARIGTCHTD